MNMQNVSNLVIPEGEVRTIHDKNNRLLWSKTAYSVKYAGDTFQQTYSGKNLFNFGQFYDNRASFTTNDGSINVTENSIDYTGHTTTDSQWYPAHEASNKSIYGMTNLQPNTTYTISYKATANSQCWVFFFDSSNRRTQVQQQYTETNVVMTFTTPANLSWYAVRIDNRAPSSNSITNIQIELGSQSSSYEPYVGGITAPNPDYPQDVQVVTGAQTVTISDGADSEDFTINLGSIELCKIGGYQDYIYKSGDDWYVHKATARIDVSSLSGWFASGSYAYKTRNGMSDILPASSDSATAVGLCNAFSGSTTNLVYDGSVDYGFALPSAGGVGILIRNKNVASLADFTTYLSNNPVYGYFALATPTDTKITDATLIEQLNAVHQWLTRYGYNATVTGNIPIIIDRTNL